MRHNSKLLSLMLAAFLIALAASAPAQSGYWTDASGRIHQGPPSAQGQQQAAPQAQGPDGTVTVTDPNTGQTYMVRARNAAQINSRFDAAAQGAPAGTQLVTTSTGNSYIQWNDPAEGAFSVSLPASWQISGGTQRTTRIEPHYVIRAQSPTGGVHMFFDDPAIAIREVPGRATQWQGVREGQTIPGAWGGRLLVQRYIPAPQIAEQYVRQRFCPTATQFQGGIIPGQSQSLNQEMGQIARSEGKQVHVDVGEVSFRCGEQSGYVYAVTLQAWQPGAPISLWLIYRLAGYLSSPQESASAAEAMHTMLGTFEMNQRWLQQFAQESNDIAGDVIRESNAITQSTIERAKAQDADMAARNETWRRNEQARFDATEHTNHAITGLGSSVSGGTGHNYNAQLGTKEVCDDLDRCQQVDANVDTYYSDCSGTFYPGSTSGEAPSSSLSACWNKGH